MSISEALGDGKIYLLKPDELMSKNQHDHWGANCGYPKAQAAQLPRLLAFSGPRIDEEHQKQNVERCQYVEKFKRRVPDRVCEGPEEVHVPGEEDYGVEGLRQEGDAFG